jgi:hypothetical protein
MQENKAKSSGRRQLIVILITAAISLLGSYGLFWIAKGGVGWGTVNNGVFVTPPTNRSDLGWQLQSDVELLQDNLWWLWLTAENCNPQCAQALKNLKATHILLNKEAERVRVAFSSVGRSTPTPSGVIRVEPTNRDMPDGIYIIDPLGNLVFFYPTETPPEDILKDLKRLLKVSQIG